MQALLGTLPLKVASLRDNLEHDLVEHRYTERGGAEQQPMGRAPYSGSMEVGFVGAAWSVEYSALRALFDLGERVSFTHPRTFEIYQVRIRRLRPTHTTQLTNGLVVGVDLVEDNIDPAGLVVTDAGVAGAAAACDASASAALAALGAL